MTIAVNRFDVLQNPLQKGERDRRSGGQAKRPIAKSWFYSVKHSHTVLLRILYTLERQKTSQSTTWQHLNSLQVPQTMRIHLETAWVAAVRGARAGEEGEMTHT
jgi:hypothetical protein